MQKKQYFLEDCCRCMWGCWEYRSNTSKPNKASHSCKKSRDF